MFVDLAPFPSRVREVPVLVGVEVALPASSPSRVSTFQAIAGVSVQVERPAGNIATCNTPCDAAYSHSTDHGAQLNCTTGSQK